MIEFLEGDYKIVTYIESIKRHAVTIITPVIFMEMIYRDVATSRI